MALGTYNNNKDKEVKKYSPIVYSDYGFSNPDSEVDKTRMSYTLTGKLLKITLDPKKNDDITNYEYDNEAGISIFLTLTKARLLHMEILAFIQKPDSFSSVGVNSGQGIIRISNGKEYGVSCPCITISKVNQETGMTESSFVYQIKEKYHYAVRNYDPKAATFDKKFYDDLELLEICTMLEQYYTAMTGAIAYTVLKHGQYTTNRIQGRIDAIADKLGVEYQSKGNNTPAKTSNSFFSKNEGRSFSSGTLDDIQSQFED